MDDVLHRAAVLENDVRKRHKRIYYEKMKLKMKEMEGKRGFMGRKVRTRLRWNAPVILTFVAICTGAFLCSFFTAGGANQLVFSLYRSSPTDPLTYLRLFTHVFGHAGWEHFSGNMVMILLLGPFAGREIREPELDSGYRLDCASDGAAADPAVSPHGASGRQRHRIRVYHSVLHDGYEEAIFP